MGLSCFFERNGFIANSAYARVGGLVFPSLWLHSLHRAFCVSRNITWGRSQLVHTWYRTQSCIQFWLKQPLSGIQFPHSHQHSGLAEPYFFPTIPFPSQPGGNERKSPQSKTIHKTWTRFTSTLHISSGKPSAERGQRVGVFSSVGLEVSPSASVVRKQLARRNWKQPSVVASSKACLSSRGLFGHCYFMPILWENIINPLLQIRELNCFCSGMTAMFSHYCPASMSTASWRLNSILLAVLQETNQTWNPLAWGWNLLPASWTLVTNSEPAPWAPTEHTLCSYVQSWRLRV